MPKLNAGLAVGHRPEFVGLHRVIHPPQVGPFYISQHADYRMSKRGIGSRDIELALQYGREIYAKSALFYVIGRKEVERYSDVCPVLREAEGVHVLLHSRSGVILTVYRNQNIQLHGFHKGKTRLRYGS